MLSIRVPIGDSDRRRGGSTSRRRGNDGSDYALVSAPDVTTSMHSISAGALLVPSPIRAEALPNNASNDPATTAATKPKQECQTYGGSVSTFHRG
mmetsp:Transcript_17514/g.51102  ORF Transcript_17514/g.51102 Transcript_17514/m.51102 type:complete len:95 (-) Transcript_17514:676-960(-)